jgi:integrase
VALIAWSTTYPLPGHVLKSQIQSVSQTLSRLSLKATIFCADAVSDGEAKSGLELPSIRPPQLAASFAFQTIVAISGAVQSGHRQQVASCDVVALKVEDVAPNGYCADRATVRQKKTGRPVRFELTEQTRQAVDEYIRTASKKSGEFMFAASRERKHRMTTRQYARLLSEWVASIGLDPTHLFGTHSLRRTKATLIYRRTGNLRAVQLLLGHTKIESTVRYLGIEVDDALSIAEQVDL